MTALPSTELYPITRRDLLWLVIILAVAALLRLGRPAVIHFQYDQAFIRWWRCWPGIVVLLPYGIGWPGDLHGLDAYDATGAAAPWVDILLATDQP